jgi:chromosome segregation protein
MQESTIRQDELRKKMLEEEQSASGMRSEIAVLENDIKHCNEAIEAAERSIKNSDGTRKKLEKDKKSAAQKLPQKLRFVRQINPSIY